ncbi:POT family-domain-containing protein [Mycena polygramma]|nr:POT family-domain-containing protein [Mycena polygramma]
MEKLSTDNAVILVPKEQPPAVHPEPGTQPDSPPSTALATLPSEKGPHQHTDAELDALYPPPTDEEAATLRKVVGPIPWVAYFLCTAELAERASYYATTGVISNFIEFPLPPGSSSGKAPGANQHAGALGKGLQYASGVTTAFTFVAYVVPIFGGYIADTRWGRYQTIIYGILVGFIGHAIMTGGAAPAVLKAGNGVAPFHVGYWILAIGAGIFKPNVAPTVLDQYTHQRPYVITTKKGERVIVDPQMTIQRIMTIYYGFINIGAFYAIASTYAEKFVGFWLAFLLPTLIYFVVPIIFLALRNKMVRKPPQGSELTMFFKVIWLALKKNRFNPWASDFWGKVSPARLAAQGVAVSPRHTEKLVSDIRRTLVACAIFLYIPLYQLNDGGIGPLLSNQGAAMISNGAPNDLLNNFNSLTIIVFTPIVAYGLYPFLERCGIKSGPIRRMTFGMFLCAAGGIAGGIVQLYVYRTSPCGNFASTCVDADGNALVSKISIWVQLVNVAVTAISELFVNVTSYEMAYARAPPNMKAAVFSICLFMSALSSALAEIITPFTEDPKLVWVYIGPAIALFVQTAIFWFRYRNVDEESFMTYEDDRVEEVHHDHAIEGKHSDEKGSENEKDSV